jgi:hypothetical protein
LASKRLNECSQKKKHVNCAFKKLMKKWLRFNDVKRGERPEKGKKDSRTHQQWLQACSPCINMTEAV